MNTIPCARTGHSSWLPRFSSRSDEPLRANSAQEIPADWAHGSVCFSDRLPTELRRALGSFFDADFSSVRVHVGSQPSSMGAIALANGDDVYFSPGRYDPNTRAGRYLIAHEVAHVIQQRLGYARNPLNSRVALLQDPELEGEAHRLASAFVGGATRGKFPADRRCGKPLNSYPEESVVQPVGGHGGIEFSQDGQSLTKPTNQIELDFYLEIFPARANPQLLLEPPPNLNNAAAPIVPPPLYVIRPKYAALEPYIPKLIKYEMRGRIPYITIANIGAGLGQDQCKIMDVKIGTATVSKKELASSGMSWWSAWKKKRKMAIADYWTNSSSRGFRVIDFSGSQGSRTDIARSEPAECFIKYFHGSGNVSYGSLVSCEQRIRNAKAMVDRILQAVDGFHNFVFIASSLLFCYQPGYGAVRVKMIDFGHSYIKGNGELMAIGDVNVRKYKSQFTQGLANLSRSLNDAAELSYERKRALPPLPLPALPVHPVAPPVPHHLPVHHPMPPLPRPPLPPLPRHLPRSARRTWAV